MFLDMSVIHSVYSSDVWPTPTSPKAHAADGAHPTPMPSC